MSTPVPPPVPNEPEPGQPAAGTPLRREQPAVRAAHSPGTAVRAERPAAPQYGQNAPPAAAVRAERPPQFGQNAPQAPQQYGQNPPQFGQPTPPAYGQQPYGQSPYAQYPSEQPQAAGSTGVPQLVNISFWLLIGAAALFVITLLMGIGMLDDPIMRDAFEDAMRSSGATGTEFNFEDFRSALAGTLVVLAILGAGMYVLVAFFVRKGKNWATDPGHRIRRAVRYQPLPGAEHRDPGNPGRHRGDRSAVPAVHGSVLPQAAAVRQPLQLAGQPVRPVGSTQQSTPNGRGPCQPPNRT